MLLQTAWFSPHIMWPTLHTQDKSIGALSAGGALFKWSLGSTQCSEAFQLSRVQLLPLFNFLCFCSLNAESLPTLTSTSSWPSEWMELTVVGRLGLALCFSTTSAICYQFDYHAVTARALCAIVWSLHLAR